MTQMTESMPGMMDAGFASTMPQDKGYLSRRGPLQAFMFNLFRCSVAINAAALAIICGYVLWYGLPAISLEFLLEHPREAMTQGGIFPCIVGTIALSYGSLLVALPWGVGTAIYLHEYAKPGPVVQIIRLAINNLAGVPSVVFGLFGLSLFVTVMGMGVSLLAGMFTLAALVLPLIIGSTEEALRNVSPTYREASLGLGATKWQTIAKVVMPAATPGILTGSILAVGRAAGETAAIMFTAAMFFSPSLPDSIFDSVMALPYHIYVMATAGTNIEQTRHLQYGTSLVLIALVLGMNLCAIIIRARLQKKLR